jgi:aspartyl-tRNA(Asn)/glutamyl-tRNA(Gln) amidotransferase subunit A
MRIANPTVDEQRDLRGPARFPDWSSMSEVRRASAAAECGRRLAHVGEDLHAVAQILTPPVCKGGPLAGLPYVVKDMIATGRADPHWGCAQAMMTRVPAAPIVDRFDAAGAALIGIAEMTELAYEPSGMNAARGAVRNPWDFDYAPGGSSSGSAALVAAGCCVAALGSDTGGSVRIPAHCCGVTALKPSWGRVSTEGTMPLAPSLDTIGILARSAADIAAIWSALFEEPVSRLPGTVTASVLTAALDESDPEIAKICRAAIDALSRCGLRVSAHSGFPEQADNNSLLVMQAEAARTHRARLDDERIDPVLRKRLGKGLAISDDELVAACDMRAALRERLLNEQGADVVLLPVMPVTTPRLGEVDPSSPQFKARTLYALSRFTRFVNYLDLPAMALPAGFDNRGMPVGLQIVGRPGSEALLLAIGMMLQAQTDWHARVPTAVVDSVALEKDW